MQRYLAALALVLFMGMVLARVALMKRKGIRTIHFGSTDKKDFLIPPFVLFYFYVVFAAAFHWPSLSDQQFFHSEVASWAGVLLFLAGLSLLLGSLVSFGKSFRIGIDTERPDKLVTTGVYSYSRNPIYVAFAFVLIGQFLVFSNWILLVYLVAGFWLFHRQVLREEDSLKATYGASYEEYCGRVRRYV
jgi:protein-S-isoprenylcysteine O-methyltransferase Ste14